MTIRISVDLEDAAPRRGTKIAYQAFPDTKATEEEINTSNVILAFCSLLSNTAFIDMIKPMIERELVIMRQEQDAAIEGSNRIM